MCKAKEDAAEGVGAGGMADLLEGCEDLAGVRKPVQAIDCQTELQV